jgi:hypothetical protein
MVGVLSTQLWHHQFIDSALVISPLRASGAAVLLGDGDPIVSGARLDSPKSC